MSQVNIHQKSSVSSPPLDPVPFEKHTALFALDGNSSSPLTNSSRQSSHHVQHKTILPATYRATNDFDKRERLPKPKIVAIENERTKRDFIRHELDLTHLNRIHPHLWIAGLPGRIPSTLHEQLIRGRTISITQRMDQHLIWTQENRLCLKPLARYFLDYEIWREYICPYAEELASARGFLLSYLWLISSESDFNIAVDIKLIPADVNWEQWTLFARSVVANISPETRDSVNQRYAYGELRMSRLNLIYRCCSNTRSFSTYIRGYAYSYTTYASFFKHNTAWLLIAIVYITIVLTAMQVGLGTNQLKDNIGFHRASYGLTVLSILGPLIVVLGMTVFILFLVVYNLRYTLDVRKKAQRDFPDLFKAENVQASHQKRARGKTKTGHHKSEQTA